MSRPPPLKHIYIKDILNGVDVTTDIQKQKAAELNIFDELGILPYKYKYKYNERKIMVVVL